MSTSTSLPAHDKGCYLHVGNILRRGDYITSPNEKYKFIFQDTDGRLVLCRNKDKFELWASPKDHRHADALVMQADGNLVLYSKNGRNPSDAIWSSDTWSKSNPVSFLELTNNGNLQVRKFTSFMYSQIDTIGEQTVRHFTSLPVWESKTGDYSRWMERLDENWTIRQLCLPGTHNSGMYVTKYQLSRVKALCQSKTIYQQLCGGVRYVNLRPQYLERDGEKFYIFHGPATGPKLREALTDVTKFLNENPSEFVMIEFSHWKDFDQKGADGAFLSLVKDCIPVEKRMIRDGDKEEEGSATEIAANENMKNDKDKVDELSKLTLKSLRGKALLLIDNQTMYYHSVVKSIDKNQKITYKSGNGGIYLKGKHLQLFDSYSESTNYDAMIRDQVEKFQYKSSSGRDIFVLNWTNTPGLLSYYKEYFTSHIDDGVLTMASITNPKLREDFEKYLSFLWSKKPNGTMVNIINTDYFELARPVEVCELIMELNNQ